MQKVEARLISVRHSPEETECLYAIQDRKPIDGDLVYDRDKGRFACCQWAAPSHMDKVMPVIIATNNKKYPTILQLPEALVKGFKEGNIKTATLRIPWTSQQT